MKNLSEQCQKSAVDLLKHLNEDAELSPGLSQVIKEGERILFVISGDVPDCAKSLITAEAKDRPHKIITTPDHTAAEYDYFGVTKGRTPILIDKAFLEHDTVIAVSFVKYDCLFGFTGGKTLIFPCLAAEKSKTALFKHALDEKIYYKNAMCFPGNMKNNPLSAEAVDALMIMRQNVHFFGINLIPDTAGNVADISCGDIFVSHISAAKKFSALYPIKQAEQTTGISLQLKDGSLQDSVPIIEQASLFLEAGGRMFINGDGLSSFGTEEFREAFFMPKTEEIFARLSENFSSDLFQAMVMKKICSRYHIAISSCLDEGSLRQAGLNPMAEDAGEGFLKDCRNKKEVWDAGGFAASR